MSPELVAILAGIFAAQARVIGMQAENQHRTECGKSIAYGEELFFYEAQELDRLSISARNSF